MAPTLATVDQLKGWINEKGAEHDAALDLLLERVEATLEAELGQHLVGEEDREFILRGYGHREVTIPQKVAAVLAVAAREDVMQPWTALSPSAWETGAGVGSQLGAGAVVRRVDGQVFPPGAALVSVTATCGYDSEADVPGDLKQVVLDFAGFLWRNRGTQQAATLDPTVILGDRLPRYLQGLLGRLRYRRFL